MVAGHVREMHLRDPRKVKLLYERRTHWSPVFDHNPKIARWDEEGDFQFFTPRQNGLRPYCSAKTQDKWTWRDYRPIPGEFFFTKPEAYFDQSEARPCDVILEPHTKPSASPNKIWPWEKWQQLAYRLVERGLLVKQVGPKGTRVLSGVGLVQTDSFRRAAAYMRLARAAVVPEGGLHHAAAAVGLKAVVLFGGFISPRQTGYNMHTNIFTGGEPCGNRLPCRHCKQAMENITPEMVLEELKKLL